MSNRRQLAKNGGPIVGVSRFFYNSRDRSKHIGAYGEVVADMCECSGLAILYLHDGKTCGGMPIGGVTCPDPEEIDVALETTSFDEATGILTMTLTNGVVINTDIGVKTVDTDTFAEIVDNGDGTFTGTNVDGTTLTWDAVNVVDTDTFTLVVDNGDGTFTGTNADGTVVSWDGVNTVPTVDTDTFATMAGTVITLANGTTIDTASFQENLVRQINGTIQLVDDAGNVSGTIPLDVTVADLTGAVTANDHGLSAGQLALPYASGGVSDGNNLQTPEAQLKSVAPVSLASGLYNSATQGIVGGVVGVRNQDGSLGHHVPFIGLSQDNPPLDGFNGGQYVYDLDVSTNENFRDGIYEGQIVYVTAKGTGANLQEGFLTGKIAGVSRSTTRRIEERSGTPLILRNNESMTLRWNVADDNWVIIEHSYGLLRGSNWRENTDGTATMFFNGNLGAVPEVVVAVPMPVAITNPENIRIQLTDLLGTVVVPGDTLTLSGATANFVTFPAGGTPTDIMAAYRVSANTGNASIQAVHVQVENAVLDYTLL